MNYILFIGGIMKVVLNRSSLTVSKQVQEKFNEKRSAHPLKPGVNEFLELLLDEYTVSRLTTKKRRSE